jgi:hypothetical protein
MKKLFTAIVIVLIQLPGASAQELNCSVEVISNRVQGVNPAIFESLRQTVFEFMNYRKWGNDQFAIEERINCSLILNIEPGASASSNTYAATLQVISARPVFGTDYNSPIINLQDRTVTFDFFPNTQFIYNPDQFQNNLVHTLAFYAYIIIGFDYDTYSPRGGTPYFLQAQRLVQAAQVSNAVGWKAFEGDRNRYWIAEDILSRTFEPMRDCMYEYHRKGMDIMSEKMPQARTAVLNALLKLDKVHKVKPLAFNTQNFFLAKSDEIVNIFIQAQPNERNALYEMLVLVDPGNMTKYQKMQKGK